MGNHPTHFLTKMWIKAVEILHAFHDSFPFIIDSDLKLWDNRLNKFIYHLYTLANWIPGFLGIPRNSQKFPIMQMTLANWIPSFLGIPRNSQEFPTMQISSDLKSLELLGISGKGRLQFCEDLEFLGILSYTNYL